MRKSKRADVIGSEYRTVTPTEERTDGLGNQIVETAEYFLQDSRTYVGNCALWWGPNGNGYTCSLDQAGIYLGGEVLTKRGTDIPWPVEHIRAATVRHVRVDGPAMGTAKYKPGKR